jgi:hypothetical protein
MSSPVSSSASSFSSSGLNSFFHFIPAPPPPSGTAGQFVGPLFVSSYLVVVFLLQIIPAVLLLINRYVPRADPARSVIVNILLFHILMADGLALAIRRCFGSSCF